MADAVADTPRTCAQCGHDQDPHVLAASVTATLQGVDEVPVAGWMTCPVDECDCWSTWSIASASLEQHFLELLDLEVARLREAHDRGEL